MRVRLDPAQVEHFTGPHCQVRFYALRPPCNYYQAKSLILARYFQAHLICASKARAYTRGAPHRTPLLGQVSCLASTMQLLPCWVSCNCKLHSPSSNICEESQSLHKWSTSQDTPSGQISCLASTMQLLPCPVNCNCKLHSPLSNVCEQGQSLYRWSNLQNPTLRLGFLLCS